jgi:hypothetical protein
MLAVMGSAFTALAILAIALMTLAFNHPRAPRWVQRELTAQLSAVAVTIVLGVGLACLVLTAGHVLAAGIALLELAALIGALALVVLVLRALKVGARLQGYQAVPAPIVPPAA